MRPKHVTFIPQNVDPDGICTAQQTVHDVAMTIGGALSEGGTVVLDVASQIGVTCTANIATAIFTIEGTDYAGVSQTLTVTGVNANTVETTAYLKEITVITPNSTLTSVVSVGTVDEFSSQIFPTNIYTDGHTVSGSVTGTIDYMLQKCLERPTAGETPVWIDLATAGQTATFTLTITDMIGGIRAIVNSFTDGATLSLRINPKARNCY